MSLPIDRTALTAAQTNQVPSQIIQSAKNIAAIQTPYDTIDELNNKVNALIASGALSPYPPAQYNQFINGNMDVWQKGTAQILTTINGTFPDRIHAAIQTTNVSSIKIDQGTLTPPVGSKYYLRYRISTASALDVSVIKLFGYKTESVDAQKFIGKQVTISFKVRSSISRNFGYTLNVFGFTAIDNGFRGTGLITGDGTYAQNTVGLTANIWATVSKTFTIQDPLGGTGLPSNGIGFELWGSYTTPGAETDTEYQFSQIQMNLGSVMLPFQPRSFAEELALCQRYYEVLDNARARYLDSASSVVFTRDFRPKRIVPTVTLAVFAGNTPTVDSTKINSVSLTLTVAGVTDSTYNIKLDAEL